MALNESVLISNSEICHSPPSPAAILNAEAFVTPTPVPASSATTFDESNLVARAQAGEQAAFAALVAEYSRKIYRVAKNITQNDEDAEDVLQETFLKAYEHLSGFQGNSKFYTWIVRIAVNESLMKLRKRKGNLFVSLDDPVEPGEEEVKREIAVRENSPQQSYSRDDMQGILNEAVDSLKPDFRTVFTLRDIEELSTEDTPEALGLSVPDVRSILVRARLALREKLTRQFRRKGDGLLGYL